MDEILFLPFEEIDLIVYKSLTPGYYYLSECSDELLSPPLLGKILKHLASINPHEVAIALDSFKNNPSHTQAHFGLAGTFLFTK